MVDLNLQVQQIIDEGSGRRRSVIVQVGSEDEVTDRLMRIAAEVHRRRYMCSSARDLLPVRQEKLEKLRALASKRLSRRFANYSEEVSLSAQAMPATYPFDRATVQATRSEAINTLLKNEFVRKALSTSGDMDQSPARFWSSQSVVLSMSKDDLYNLSRSSSSDASLIRGIYPNRPLRIPRIIETKSLDRKSVV